jgi:hypothetical protein
MDRVVERRDIGEGLMSEVVRLEIAPDDLDVIESRGVFGQALNGEPVCPASERCARELIPTLVETDGSFSCHGRACPGHDGRRDAWVIINEIWYY